MDPLSGSSVSPELYEKPSILDLTSQEAAKDQVFGILPTWKSKSYDLPDRSAEQS